MAKKANSSNNVGREMKFGSLDGGEHPKHNGVDFVEISRIFGTQDLIFYMEQDHSTAP